MKQSDTRLPYAEFSIRPGEVMNYGFDWEQWLERRWRNREVFAPGTRIRPTESTGYQYSSSGGQSAQREPVWPRKIGSTIVDGSITWTCEAIDSNSLEASISTSDWTCVPTLPFTPSRDGNETRVTVDANAAVDGTEYVLTNEVATSTALQKRGVIRLLCRVDDQSL